MDIATINHILLPPFLFIFYFCVICFLHYNVNTTAQSELPIIQTQPEQENFSIAQAFSEEFDPEPEQDEEFDLEPEPDTGTQITPFSREEPQQSQPQISKQLYDQIAAIIENLTKRQSRKLCSPVVKGGLGIQQKRQGVEKSLEFIKAEIKAKFKTNPEPVIAVIRNRLPELLTSLTQYQEAS